MKMLSSSASYFQKLAWTIPYTNWHHLEIASGKKDLIEKHLIVLWHGQMRYKDLNPHNISYPGVF